ncbi:hypothetical protein [Clostridium sp. Marseille-P299]|uniref:hypothetical protein n=1 Tax=Clostridium sp. Marseille-P299 TaxID=1805477 RepID=UPI000B1DBA83
MKKSSLVAMVLGTLGGIFLALGMCMCLLPEWNAFKPGVAMGGHWFSSTFGYVNYLEKDGEEGADKALKKNSWYCYNCNYWIIAIWHWYVYDYGVEPNGNWNCYWYRRNRCITLLDSFRKGDKVKLRKSR